MNGTIITAIGLVAGILTTVAWLPQVVKTWQMRTAKDFSWGYLSMFAAGVLAWAIYGALRRDVAILGANLITLGLVVTIVVVKTREK